MKKTSIATAFLIASLMISLSVGIVFAPKISSERFLGYNLEKTKWTTGNLGKDYHEGDFVSYQLWIDETSKVWGASAFSISFNFFQASSGAVYVDGFDTSAAEGFQYTKNGAFLPDGTQIPVGWDAIPTPAAGGASGGPTIGDYMAPWPPGTDEAYGATPAKEHYFTVKDLVWPDTPDAIDHIILFFRAHLALDIIWNDAEENLLPQSLDGDMFEDWTAAWRGASFATGSSRHFTLHYEGIGDKTIPIPIAQYPTAFVSGYKYVRYCAGDYMATVKANGWEITLDGIILGNIPYSKTVVTGTSPWETGYFEFNGLIAGDYTLTEENRAGYTADPPGPSISFSLEKDGTFVHDFTNYGPAPT